MRSFIAPFFAVVVALVAGCGDDPQCPELTWYMCWSDELGPDEIESHLDACGWGPEFAAYVLRAMGGDRLHYHCDNGQPYRPEWGKCEDPSYGAEYCPGGGAR